MRLATAGFAAVLLAAGFARPLAQASRPPAPQVDPKAVAVLEAMDDAFARAKGLLATYRSEQFRPDGRPAGEETVQLTLGRPNVYRVETVRGQTAQPQLIASDGTTRFSVRPGNPPRCTTWKVAPRNESRELDSFNPIYWSFYDLGEWQIRSAMLGHWSTTWRLADPGLRSLRYAGRETQGELPLDVVEWTYTIGYSRPEDVVVYTSRLFIAPDHFPRRVETTSSSKKEYEGRRIVETISRIVPAEPARETFAYSPPGGVTCAAVDPEASYTTGRFADLPAGSRAPDFTLTTARGEILKLSAFLAKHKVVLLNFWGYG
jgi:hypothetical protein